MFFASLMRQLIKRGELTLIDAQGGVHTVGNPATGPKVAIRLRDPVLHFSLFFNPRLRLGEAYMDGLLTVENGRVYDLLDLIARNLGEGTVGWFDRWKIRAAMLWRRVRQANRRPQSRRNVAHHYDLSGALYDLFLDADRQYSCAYFLDPQMDLETAQLAKKRHIAAKLLLRPGDSVLDVGSGWGGLAAYLSEVGAGEVTGITLSQEQLAHAQRMIKEQGFDSKVKFHLRDYREQTGRFDRIVSVGMFEHVGVPNYETFFRKIGELLADDGVALIHTIAHRGPPFPTNAWIQKYIFPGGYTPSLSEMLPAIEAAGLWVTDIEILRLHYAETLRHWRQRFLANRERAARLYDERFCRMWEFYLAGCEAAFRYQGQMVAQIQIAKSIDTVPLDRDYIAAWESAHPLPGQAEKKRLRLA